LKLYKQSLKINGYEINTALNELDAINNLDYDSFNAWKKDRFRFIVNYHKKDNETYSDLLKNSNGNDLPILTKSFYQKDIIKLLSRGYKTKDVYIGQTSGSSGHPFYFAKNKYAHAISHAQWIRKYKQHNLNVDDKQARFYGIPVSGLSRYKELFKDFLQNRTRFPVFDLSDGILEKFLLQFKYEKYVYIYGYTSSITLFAKYLLSKRKSLIDVCPSLRFCIVTSEVCTPEDKLKIEKAFGIKVLNEYGASEVGQMAFTDTNDRWVLSKEDLYFEIVDIKGNKVPYGQEGRILVTSLFNKAFPVIRYEIGDIGIIKRYNNDLILEKLTGRTNDFAVLPSGKISPGLTFYYISKSILEKSNSIKEFIIKQTKLNKFVFEIVGLKEITNEEKKLIKQQAEIYLEPGLTIEIKMKAKLTRPNSGKIKHFYSMI
jgi:phenylacetate-CoA ligase